MQVQFKKAIVKRPGESLPKGITTANLGKPDIEIALEQHDIYIQTLQDCGLEVTILSGDPSYPDCTFIEDTAVLTPYCAVITNPGAASRRGEVIDVRNTLQNHFNKLEFIVDPGTLDGGLSCLSLRF